MNPTKIAIKYRQLIKERMSKHNIGTAHDQRSHWYTFDGKKYPSVTAHLQTLKDEGLMNWKMNRAVEFIEKAMLVHPNDPWSIESTQAMLQQAKLAPQLEFEGAGSIGTAVHDFRETVFSHVIDGKDWPYAWATSSDDSRPPVISGIRAIKKFQEETGYIPVACELSLADHDLGIGGMLDDIGILPHPQKIPVTDIADLTGALAGGYKTKYTPKLALIDLKTSNIGDKTSYFLQVALYYYMFKKLTGITCQEFYILHVSKYDGTYKLIPIKNINQRIKDAKLLIKLNKSLAQINEDKKKESIIV